MERQWLDLSGTHLRETSASAMNGCLGSFEEAKVLSPPSPPSGSSAHVQDCSALLVDVNTPFQVEKSGDTKAGYELQ